jgi:hypothetical protein
MTPDAALAKMMTSILVSLLLVGCHSWVSGGADDDHPHSLRRPHVA